VERFEKQKKQIKEALEAISDAYYSACQEAGEAVDPAELNLAEDIVAHEYDVALRVKITPYNMTSPFRMPATFLKDAPIERTKPRSRPPTIGVCGATSPRSF
jgi:hypothetical protein